MPSEHEVVRVVKLVQPSSDYDSWRLNQRNPQVGDVGTVVHILSAPGLIEKYAVEMCGTDGRTIWLADFFAEEIESLNS